MKIRNDNNVVHSLSVAEKQKKTRSKMWVWQITLLSLGLSTLFGLLAEFMLLHTNLFLALLLIIILVAISVIFDIIGMAVTAGNIKTLLEKRSNNIKGAVTGIWLIKNADKVSSICTDVIGDICSILSGAGGVAISLIVFNASPTINSFWLSIAISGIIASLNVLGKAIGKTYAISSADHIVLTLGKYYESLFKIKKNVK